MTTAQVMPTLTPDEDADLEPPMIFDADGMLKHLLYDDPSDLTVDYLSEALIRVGRNDGPRIMIDLYCEGLLRRRAVLVPDVWAMVEHPLNALDRFDWWFLFNFAGYTHNGKRRARPRNPRQLYRGPDEALRDGWSGTDDRKVAQWFAERIIHTEPGRVWTGTVEPDRLLARIAGYLRQGENEYVVDTDGLEIVAVR